jgi:hypothetical protein
VGPLCHGGFADVWKGQHRGREVAAKVLRVYLTSDFERIRKVDHPRLVVCTNGLTVSGTGVLQGSCNVEVPPSPKRTATIGRNDGRESVCDGVGLDGKR